MIKYTQLKTEYGEKTLELIRKYEKLSRIYGRYSSHLRFMLQCKHVDIIPKNCKIKTQLKEKEARRLLHKTEKALLNLRIGEINKKKRRIATERKDAEKTLRETINIVTFEEIQQINKRRENREYEKAREIHKKKYMRIRYGETRRETEVPVQQQDQPQPQPQQQAQPTNNNEQSREEKWKERWVKNISSRELTIHERSILEKGGDFAIAPMNIPYEEMITAIETACINVSKGQGAALRGEATKILCEAKQPKSNITKEERRALSTLKKDETIIIVPADKGKCLVVMDKDEYVKKMEAKLADRTTYEPLEKDPTYDIKDSIMEELNSVKARGEINDKQLEELTPKGTLVPRMYGQPKIHKEGFPMREIVDATGGVTKQLDKYIARIMKTYVGKTEHFIRNSAHFVETIKPLQVEENETLVSFDVVALYPSVPQEEVIQIFYDKMKNDEDLAKKSPMSAESIRNLFIIIVRTTYFTFNKKLRKQIDGLAIGASSSGFGAELFMEILETKAIQTFINPPTLWLRYVDDTFAKLFKTAVEAFKNHLNSQHPRIKFTSEMPVEGKIPFLDTHVQIESDKTISTTIYRKPTHTDQYLHFKSNHHIKQKLGILSTFRHRIETVITKKEDKEKEEIHMQQALRRCEHPEWAVKRRKKRRTEEPREKEHRPKVVIPYIKHTSEKLAHEFRKHGIQTIHKPTTKVKNILCTKKKDKIHDLDKAGVIYEAECKKHKSIYIGETDRALKERAYEHRLVTSKEMKISHSIIEPEVVVQEDTSNLRRSTRNKERINYRDINDGKGQYITEGTTAVSSHIALKDHKEGDMTLKIIGVEKNTWKRKIKEALAIKEKKPDLNEDQGRYLSAIYDLLPRKFGNPDQPIRKRENEDEEEARRNVRTVTTIEKGRSNATEIDLEN